MKSLVRKDLNRRKEQLDRQSTDKRASRTEKGAYSGVRKKEVTSGGLKSRRKRESFLSYFNILLCLVRLLYSSIHPMNSTKPRQGYSSPTSRSRRKMTQSESDFLPLPSSLVMHRVRVRLSGTGYLGGILLLISFTQGFRTLPSYFHTQEPELSLEAFCSSMPFFVPLSVLKARKFIRLGANPGTDFLSSGNQPLGRSHQRKKSSQLPVNGPGPKTTAFAAESMSAGFPSSLAARLPLGLG